MDILFLLFIGLLIIGWYMLPTIVAFDRAIEGIGSVIVINIFFGWTLIGWVLALAIAFSGKNQRKTVLENKTIIQENKYTKYVFLMKNQNRGIFEIKNNGKIISIKLIDGEISLYAPDTAPSNTDIDLIFEKLQDNYDKMRVFNDRSAAEAYFDKI